MKEWIKEKLESLMSEGRVECMSDISPEGAVDIRWTSNRRRETVQIIQSGAETNAEVAHIEDQDALPATIVESTEAEVFTSQESPSTIVDGTHEEVFAGREEERIESAEAQLSEIESITGPESEVQPETNPYHSMEQSTQEQPKKPKVNRRPYVELVTQMLEQEGGSERQTIIDAVLKKFPTVSKGGIATFLTDAKNPKYSYFKDRAVIVHPKTGKLIFADRVEAFSSEDAPEQEGPAMETTTAATQPEQQAE